MRKCIVNSYKHERRKQVLCIYTQIKLYVVDFDEVDSQLAKLDFHLTLPAPSYTEDESGSN